MKLSLKLFLMALIAALFTSCASNETPADTNPSEAAAQVAEAEWTPLLSEDLSNADFDPTCWKMEAGVLSASEDKMLWVAGEYENFELELAFKNDPGTNSGVIVYCSDTKNWVPNSVEVQIADDHSEKWGTSRKDFQCWAIFGHLAASEQLLVRPPGEWNQYHIVCKGPEITVTLNGKTVTEMDMTQWTSGTENPDGSEIPSWLPTPLAELPTKGAIGFQGKHGDAKIYLRNINIRQL